MNVVEKFVIIMLLLKESTTNVLFRGQSTKLLKVVLSFLRSSTYIYVSNLKKRKKIGKQCA